MEISISFDAEALRKSLHMSQTRFNEALIAGTLEAAQQIELRAKELCPVGDGDLRGSIQSESLPNQTIPGARVYSDSQYAIYVHEGTGLYARNGRGRTDVPWAYEDESGRAQDPREREQVERTAQRQKARGWARVRKAARRMRRAVSFRGSYRPNLIWTNGNKPTPFLEMAANELRDKVPGIIRDAIVRTLRG